MEELPEWRFLCIELQGIVSQILMICIAVRTSDLRDFSLFHVFSMRNRRLLQTCHRVFRCCGESAGVVVDCNKPTGSRKSVIDFLVASYGAHCSDERSYIKCTSYTEFVPVHFFPTHVHVMRVCIFHLYRKWVVLCIPPDKT
jgi:hypothetical protein